MATHFREQEAAEHDALHLTTAEVKQLEEYWSEERTEQIAQRLRLSLRGRDITDD